jgi:D-alanine transfer protein
VSNSPRLRAALLTISVLLAGVWIGETHAASVERRSLDAIVSLTLEQKTMGSVLQQAAFQRADLLPVYGSSELLDQREYVVPYHARNLFRGRPTGFQVFPVAKEQATCLVILQKIAAIGAGLRGRKLVVSLSPSYFFKRDRIDATSYAGNFSALHAYALAFGTGLSRDLRRDAARRMLEYPGTLTGHPLLRAGLFALADDTPAQRALGGALAPLAAVQLAVLRAQDHWEALRSIAQVEPLPAEPPRSATEIDWAALARAGAAEQALQAESNPFGFDDITWRANRDELGSVPAPRVVRGWRRNLEQGTEWSDLELLLRALGELGARPLLISPPIHGPFYDRLGFAHDDRALYYDRLLRTAARHGVPVAAFEEHDEDRYFCTDPWSHLGPRGWTEYARTIDDFFHDRPLDR